MIAPVEPEHHQAIADFWIKAWEGVFPALDFKARRPWILNHLGAMHARGEVARGYFECAKPLAFYTLYSQTGLIEQICVSPIAGRGGLGALLMRDAAQQTGQNLNLIVNEDNKSACSFYAKLGFVETGRGVNPDSFMRTITLMLPR